MACRLIPIMCVVPSLWQQTCVWQGCYKRKHIGDVRNDSCCRWVEICCSNAIYLRALLTATCLAQHLHDERRWEIGGTEWMRLPKAEGIQQELTKQLKWQLLQ